MMISDDDFRHYCKMQSKIKTKKQIKTKPKKANQANGSAAGTKLSAMTLAYNLDEKEQKTQPN